MPPAIDYTDHASILSATQHHEKHDRAEMMMALWVNAGMGVIPKPPEAVDTFWKFLTSGACYTKDEITKQIRPFPTSKYGDNPERYNYMKLMVDDLEVDRPIWACEKSRRMMISWVMVAKYLYLLLTEPNSHFFFASRSLEKSAFMLGSDRMQCIYENIPSDIWPNLPKLSWVYKLGDGWEAVDCPATGSSIDAIGEGANQLNQFTITRGFFDEFSMHQHAREMWSAVVPTIMGGGRIDLVMTPKMGSFAYEFLYPRNAADNFAAAGTRTGDKKTFNDYQIDQMTKSGVFGTSADTYGVTQVLCKGLEVRDTVTGIHVMRLHYSCDPEKDTPDWIAKARVGLSEEQFQEQYEINWFTGGGAKVYNNFKEEWHVSKEDLREKIHPKTSGGIWMRGWDFGTTPVCVWCWLSPAGQFCVLDCMHTWDGVSKFRSSHIAELAPKVVVYSQIRWPDIPWIDYIDPSGFAKAQTDGRTCAMIMDSCGIKDIRPGKISADARHAAVLQILGDTCAPGEPKFLINCSCDMVRQVYRGGYVWKPEGKNSGRFQEFVDKNAWSHVAEAIEYPISAVYVPTTTTPAPVEYEPNSAVAMMKKLHSGRRRR
jgi:hypothetical protein